MTTYKVYSGYNAPFLVEIRDIKGVLYNATDMATITRVKIKYISAVGEDSVMIDSSLVANVFDWSKYASTGELQIDLGPLDLTAGRDQTAELVVYDSTYTSGRPVKQIDLYISDELRSGSISAASSVLNITAGQTLTTGNLGQSICIAATETINLDLPSMGEAEDGKWVEITWDGKCAHTVTAVDGDTMGDDTETVLNLKVGDTYGNLRLTYQHQYTGWVVNRSGGISAS